MTHEEDIHHCRRNLERAADQLADYRVRRSNFQSELYTVRRRWDDSAGRTVFDRYIEPFMGRGAGVLSVLGQHHEQLREALRHLESAAAPEREVFRLSECANELRESIKNRVDSAHCHIDLAAEQGVESHEHAKRAREILSALSFPTTPELEQGQRTPEN